MAAGGHSAGRDGVRPAPVTRTVRAPAARVPARAGGGLRGLLRIRRPCSKMPSLHVGAAGGSGRRWVGPMERSCDMAQRRRADTAKSYRNRYFDGIDKWGLVTRTVRSTRCVRPLW